MSPLMRFILVSVLMLSAVGGAAAAPVAVEFKFKSNPNTQPDAVVNVVGFSGGKNTHPTIGTGVFHWYTLDECIGKGPGGVQHFPDSGFSSQTSAVVIHTPSQVTYVRSGGAQPLKNGAGALAPEISALSGSGDYITCPEVRVPVTFATTWAVYFGNELLLPGEIEAPSTTGHTTGIGYTFQIKAISQQQPSCGSPSQSGIGQGRLSYPPMPTLTSGLQLYTGSEIVLAEGQMVGGDEGEATFVFAVATTSIINCSNIGEFYANPPVLDLSDVLQVPQQDAVFSSGFE